MWRIALGGPVLGVLGAVLVAAIGGGGRAGLATVLLFTAAGCITAALVSLGQAVLDEYRRAPVALRRVGWAAALVLATMITLVLLAGVVGAAA